MPWADPSLSLLRTKQSRDRGEDTNTLQSWTPHRHLCLAPALGASSGALRGHPHAEQPDTYINLAEDDINDAANHYEEVKDVPRVPKVALPGKSQRRGVNFQGLSQGRDRWWSPEEGVPKGSPMTSLEGVPEGSPAPQGEPEEGMVVRPCTLWSVVWSYLAMV